MEKNPHNRVANNSRHIKRIIHHDQMEFIPGIQGFSNICRSNNAIHHVNKLKNKSHMIISIDVEEAFDKIEHPFMVKTDQKVGIEEAHLNIIRPYTANLQQTSFSMVKN